MPSVPSALPAGSPAFSTGPTTSQLSAYTDFAPLHLCATPHPAAAQRHHLWLTWRALKTNIAFPGICEVELTLELPLIISK